MFGFMRFQPSVLILLLALGCADSSPTKPNAVRTAQATFRIALGADSASLGGPIDSLRVQVLDSVRVVRSNMRSDCVHLTVPIPTPINYRIFLPNGGLGTATISWPADSGRQNAWMTAAWASRTLLLAQVVYVRAPCDTVAGMSS